MEPLWRKIIVPVIAGIILMVVSAVVGYTKLVVSAIADPYAGNIYWEPCLKQAFSQNGRCFFTAYRVVNKSPETTENLVKFDFEIYKPTDVNLIPTRLSRSFAGKRTSLSSLVPEAKVIVVSSSEVETEFEVFTGKVTPWDGDQTFGGWLRIIASFPYSIPVDDVVDIVTSYWSYTPMESVKQDSELLTIAGVPYPDANANKKALVQKREIIASQKEAFRSYLFVFLLLLILTFLAGSWSVKVYTQHHNKLKQEEEKLEEGRRTEQEKQRALQTEHETESKLDEEFAATEKDEEAISGGKQESPENKIAPPATKGEDPEDKKNAANKKEPEKKLAKKKPKKIEQ